MHRQRLVDSVKSGRVLVSDGAWGTFLQRRGMEPGTCPELWCLERPEVVREIATAYVNAGADMVQTNSFGANRFKLAHYGLSDSVAALNEAAAAASRHSAGPERHVIASVGPTGKLLMMGDVTEQELSDCFCEQVTALEAGGADACCIETMSAIDEALLAVKAARERTSLEVICTFTFERTCQGSYRTMMGVSPTDMTEALRDAGVDVLGANCGNGMEHMVEIVAEIRQADPGIPILVHANAGMPVNANGVDMFPETPEQMAGHTSALIDAGANIVGGCCGTTPEHIAAVAAVVRKRNAAAGLV